MPEGAPVPPFHLINSHTGRHLGPFTTDADAALARTIDVYGVGWSNARIVDTAAFSAYLKSVGT